MIRYHLHHYHYSIRRHHRPRIIYYTVNLRLPPIAVHTTVPKDTHTHMNCIEQRIRQLRVFDNSLVCDDLNSIPMASLPDKFKMPDIERYIGVGCPYIHFRLYSTVMRAHGLDELQMITMFPLSLSGIAQRWFVSLESSRHKTWDDLA